MAPAWAHAVVFRAVFAVTTWAMRAKRSVRAAVASRRGVSTPLPPDGARGRGPSRLYRDTSASLLEAMAARDAAGVRRALCFAANVEAAIGEPGGADALLAELRAERLDPNLAAAFEASADGRPLS